MFRLRECSSLHEIAEKKPEVGEYRDMKPNTEGAFKEAKDFFDALFSRKDMLLEIAYKEKVDLQNKEIKAVESGEKEFNRSNTLETGNYGEMKTDQILREMGYKRISEDMVTDIRSKGHQGLDGVYENPNGIPRFVIVDAKYGTAQLNPQTLDGKQMSENWIDKRLDISVGKEKADEIRMEKLLNPDNVGSYVAHVDKEGNVTYDKLDADANVIAKDVKINE